MGRVPAASESDQRCALLGGLRVIEHSPVLGNTAFSYYEAAHKAHVARMRQRGAAVDKEFWPTPRERAGRASRRSMTVTRTTIWTRTSNRAAREAPAVVRCGRVRPQLILLFGGGLSHGIPCRGGDKSSRRITTGEESLSDYRYRRWQYRVWRPAMLRSIRGRDGVEKSFVDATDGVLKALSSSSPRKPYMKLAIARMYHEILTKVGCIEADAPVPSVLE